MAETAPDSIYSERYVAFIDILGFSEIVRKSVGKPEQATELVRILERISTRTGSLAYDGLFGEDFRAQSFSDCIVLSEIATDGGLEHLLQVVTDLSLDLLANNILTRGGVAKGKLHHSDRIVFGPALVEAYRLETSIAEYPRIVVDRAIHLDFKRIKQTGRVSWIDARHHGQLRHGDDGPVFVDIFASLRDLSGSPPERLTVIGATCREAIQRHLNEAIYDPRIYRKLQWLAGYWNSVVMGQEIPKRMGMVVFPIADDLR